MKRTLLACLLLFGVLINAAFGAESCNECKDLPFLYKELLEQEYLRDQFDSYVKQSYYPPTVKQMYTSVEKRFKGTFYPTANATPGSGSAAGKGAGAAYGTRTWLKSCDLAEFLKDENGDPLLDKDDNPVVKPITPQQLRAKECRAIADHVLRHEGHHQQTCRETQRGGTTDEWEEPEFVAKDEVQAYQEGIAALRETIARLAGECQWEGSTRKTKPDGTSVVPTKEQIADLKNNSRKIAKSLRKAKR